jgi:hypothetical protein
MALPTGRSQKRIEREVLVELAFPGPSQQKETALAQNVSSRGIRVTTEHSWHPGETILLSSPETGVHTQARVVYCQPLESGRFAIGLELFEPVKSWTKPH